MNRTDPLFVLIKLYDNNRGYFYQDNFQKFKLFASWYLQNTVGTEYVGAQLPWYRRSYELQELAKILKISERNLLAILAEIHNDYTDRNG